MIKHLNLIVSTHFKSPIDCTAVSFGISQKMIVKEYLTMVKHLDCESNFKVYRKKIYPFKKSQKTTRNPKAIMKIKSRFVSKIVPCQCTMIFETFLYTF